VSEARRPNLVQLDTRHPVWDRFFSVAPLTLVGTREADGSDDIAPKHLAMPMSWKNHFGFVCTPRHRTYQNIARTHAFTVSFPRPDQVTLTSLAAEPRCDDDTKPDLQALERFPATQVDAPLVAGAYAFLECRLERIVDGLGDNSLIIGMVAAAAVDPAALRSSDGDDQALLHAAPLLAYLYPGRLAVVADTLAFPFPRGFKR
jgi:flavin reductase (DIM6/NTAB) family NADH-FMN oxidoreductase RutF